MVTITEITDQSATIPIIIIEVFQSVTKTDSEEINYLFKKRKHSNVSIIVNIDTLGGDFEACFSIYTDLKTLPNPTIGIAYRAASGGLVILLGCKRRIAASHNAQFSIHPVHVTKSVPKLKRELMDAIQKYKNLLHSHRDEHSLDVFLRKIPFLNLAYQEQLESILIKNTRLSHQQILDIMDDTKPYSFDSEEAFNLGVVHQISNL